MNEAVLLELVDYFYSHSGTELFSKLYGVESQTEDGRDLIYDLLLSIGADQAARRKYLLDVLGPMGLNREQLITELSKIEKGTSKIGKVDPAVMEQITVFLATHQKLFDYQCYKLIKLKISPIRLRLEKADSNERELIINEINQFNSRILGMNPEQLINNVGVPPILKQWLKQLSLLSFLDSTGDIGKDIRLLNIIRKVCIVMRDDDSVDQQEYAVASTEAEI